MASADIHKESSCQHTIAQDVFIEGKGLLHGLDVKLVIKPDGADRGIRFKRVDLDPPVEIPATIEYATNRPRRSALVSGDIEIEMVEHLLSALAGLKVDNAIIELDACEIPCGDGSARIFTDAILKAGIKPQESPRRHLVVREPILIQEEGAMIAAFPSSGSFEVYYSLEYKENSSRIPSQSHTFTSRTDTYLDEIASARTYSLEEEAKNLVDSGYCMHLSPSDMLVIGDNGPIDNSYRYWNEPVRHKVMDLIGDLYLAGRPIEGRIVAMRSGHVLNRKLCQELIRREQVELREEAVSSRRALDIRAIQRVMPHRYPMLLVDRVLEIEGDERAIGVKNVSINEPFFQGHYPRTPIMPGVLIVESMAQLGGLLMSRRLEHTGKIAVLLSLDKVKLRASVTPGDQLVLYAEAVSASARSASLKCRAFVKDRLVAEAGVRFMMLDAEEEPA